MVVFKNRYLLLEIFWINTPLADSSLILTPSVVSAAIQESLQLNFGDHGLGCVLPSLQVKYVNPITSLCLVRCSRQEYQRVWCAIMYISALRKHPVLFNLLDLSGNIRSCRKSILKYDVEKLRQLKLKPVLRLITEAVCESSSCTNHWLDLSNGLNCFGQRSIR